MSETPNPEQVDAVFERLTTAGAQYYSYAEQLYVIGNFDGAAAAAALSTAASTGAALTYVTYRDRVIELERARQDEWRAEDARRYVAAYDEEQGRGLG